MSINPQLAELEQKHQELETKIEEAMEHPGSDDLKISELKRQKLKLKDRIVQLKGDSSVH